jgi:3-hydroxy-9,10-secoandrosta-1,3,5(10)-triene-9,17-dione monooxygenase reductase component
VVTALDAKGEKTGITISSFNSVSLEPPLILWSIGLDSMSYDVFVKAENFAVHILARDQKELCERFAQRGENKFENLSCLKGLHDVPILPDFAACFECSTEDIYAGGDHKIIVGRVHRYEAREADPLVYHRSRFLDVIVPTD